MGGGTFDVSARPGTSIANLKGSGTISGKLTVTKTVATDGSGGALAFDDDFTIADSSLTNITFRSGTFTTNSYGNLHGASGIRYGGTLNLIFDPAVAYTAGVSVRIFDFERVEGAFLAVNVSGLRNGLTALFDAATGSVMLAPKPSEELSAIRTMSYNMRNSGANDGDSAWPIRKALWFQSVEDFDPDLLGVQEALADQYDQIKSTLTDYDVYGVARNNGNRSGEWAAVLVRRSRFEVLNSGTFWLSETPDVVGSTSWDAANIRICSWVRMIDRSTGGVILCANTHFDHRSNLAKIRSAELLNVRLRQLAQGAPIVLMGDFNSAEGTEPYELFLGPSGRFLDSYREVHPNRTSYESSSHSFNGGTTGNRIDWILHTPDLLPTNATIVQTGPPYPSDHYPVTATFVPAGSSPNVARALWNYSQFGADSNLPAVADASPNPAGDGIPNLMKFAFGMGAMRTDQRGLLPAGVTVESEDERYAGLRFRMRKSPSSGISYVVEESENLRLWEPLDTAMHLIGDVMSLDDEFDEITVRMADPLGSKPASFLRVKLLEAAR